MADLLRTPTTAVWLALVAATGLSWALGTDHGGVGATTAGVLLILVAVFKARCIGLFFMELRDAPAVLRRIFEAYVVTVAVGLTVIFLVV